MKQVVKTYHIAGMHCASCEILIEKTLLEMENIVAVDASTSKEEVTITTKEKTHVTPEDIATFLRKKGLSEYSCYANKKNVPKQTWYIPRGGNGQGIDLNWPYITQAIGPYGIVIALYILVSVLGVAKYVQGFSFSETTSVSAVFVLGVVASISSCAALVGGILLSFDAKWKTVHTRKTLLSNHVQFHIGRVVAFVLFGGFLGILGEKIQLSSSMSAVLVIIISVIMIAASMQILGFVWASKLIPKIPSSLLVKIASSEKKGAFAIGASTVFLPCGFTLVAQSSAMLSGSFFQGALLLGVFSLGTLPVLSGISFLGAKSISLSKNSAELFTKVVALIIVVFSFYTINSQLTVLSFPNVSELLKSNVVKDEHPVSVIDGVQEISLIAKGFSYTATSQMTVNAGQPVRLVVDNQGVVGCAAYLSVFGLSDDFTPLSKGKNIIDLGNLEKGKYRISCSMGMVSPIILTVK